MGVWGAQASRCPELAKVVHCRNCEVYSAAGRTMLGRDLPTGYRKEWAGIVAQPKQKQVAETESVLVFRLGDEWMALPAGVVEEVAQMRAIHRVPHYGQGAIRGLVNLRGQLRICVSLGRLMGVEKGRAQGASAQVERVFERLIAVAREDTRFVFATSEVLGTRRYHPGQLQDPPATISRAKGTYTRGIVILGEREVACLDAELLFYGLNRSLS